MYNSYPKTKPSKNGSYVCEIQVENKKVYDTLEYDVEYDCFYYPDADFGGYIVEGVIGWREL